MNFPYVKTVSSEWETLTLAQEFVNALIPGDIVCLNGNLGSGKTFFVKGICTVLGIDTATSPSFAIVNEYGRGQKIIHFDFYRIKKTEELYDIGFEDYLLDADSIVFIEWANMYPEVLPKRFYLVEFTIINQEKREIRITKHG